MILSIEDETDNRLRLVKDGIGVEFTGNLAYDAYFVYSSFYVLNLAPRLLVEYEIKKEVLQIASINNMSRAYVQFVFTRRMEFHLSNTFLQVIFLKIISTIVYYICVTRLLLTPIEYFLQSLILAMVGYLSYFFDIDKFTDRIMVISYET